MIAVQCAVNLNQQPALPQIEPIQVVCFCCGQVSGSLQSSHTTTSIEPNGCVTIIVYGIHRSKVDSASAGKY